MKVYFPGLGGLRFLAALAVAVSHVELLKQYAGQPSAYDRPAVYELGRLSVTFFFVLSGYLITYLLMAERKLTGDISVKGFYVRRVLRIWPLYYLLVLLSFFVFPHLPGLEIPEHTAAAAAHASATLPLFLLLLPQLALSLYEPVPFAEPLWSIGVEEQFYLVWPLLMKRFRSVPAVAVTVIAAAYGARHLALALATASRADPARLLFWNQVIGYLYFTRIECMAIGALFAWCVFAPRPRILAFLHARVVQAAVYAATAWLFLTDWGKPMFSYGLPSVLFGAIILNVSTNPRSLVRLRGRWLDTLGNLSFGLYMFHEVAIQSALHALGGGSDLALYGVGVTAAIALAAVSYFGFERFFLRLKPRFGVIASGAGDR